MSYSTLISLADAKTYLGVDDTSRDMEITRMTLSAIRYIEKATNHILEAQDRDYVLTDGYTRVYDYPINTTSDYLEKKNLYSIYSEEGATEVTLNVGYENDSDVPEDLLDACYLMLGHLFFGQEDKGSVPKMVNLILQENRRFII